MYREPAENEDAKLDAAEVAAFQAKMGGARAAQRNRVIFALVVGGVGLAFTLAFAGGLTDKSTMRVVGDPDCHSVFEINVDSTGTHSMPIERLVCDAGIH